MYHAALTYAERAFAPIEERAPIQARVADPPTIRRLKEALEYVYLKPAENR